MTAITSYGTLKTAIASKMNRTDLTAEMAGFVQRAEEHINRELRHQNNLYRNVAFSFTAEYTAKPTDMVELVALEIDVLGNRRTIDAGSAAFGINTQGTDPGGTLSIMLVNDQIRLSPPPSGIVSGDLLYYRGVTTITGADADTNWLLTSHSAVYLYRSLMEASIHMRDNKRLSDYGAAFQGHWESVLRHGRRQRQSAAMRVRLG